MGYWSCQSLFITNFVASLVRFELTALCSASKCSDPLSYRDVCENDFTTKCYTANMKFTLELTPKPEHNDLVINFLNQHWGSVNVVSRGKITDASTISRIIVSSKDSGIIGLTTFLINDVDHSCELVSIDAEEKSKGIGTKMMKFLEKIAKEKGVKRIWLITTNDNYDAARFYIKNGYRLFAIHKDALDISRKLKPQIPKIGKYGIPLQDEWEFEKFL